MGQHTETTRYFKVLHRDLVYLKFITESHEGLATVSTVDRERGIVAITCPSHFAKDMEAMIQSLGTEIALQELPETEII